MKYHWPPSGAHEPFELYHYIGSYLYNDALTVKEKGRPRLNATRDVIGGLLERYANGIYQYKHSKSFNPQVAATLKDRVDATVRHGVTFKKINDLTESLTKAIDRHYLEIGQLDKTRKGIQKLRKELKAKRRR